MDFIIDTTGFLSESNSVENPQEPIPTEGNDGLKKLLEKYKDSLEPSTSASQNIPKARNKSHIAKFCEEMGWSDTKPERKITASNKCDIKEVLKKSVITPDSEKLRVISPMGMTKKKLKKLRKEEREKTKGKNWFHLPATEMTDEIKTDLEIIKMRSVLDPKHFYKKNDMDSLPKYFQIGKVLDSPLDHYNTRLTKKERKRTLVDELLADAEFNKYNKRKYQEIIQEKQKTHYKAYMKAKKLKRKNKK